MKVVLFCGGLGLRIRGAYDDVPKPLVEVGSRPILWHVMKYYAHYGHDDFILCLGHKGEAIKSYFQSAGVETGGWRVTFVDTDVGHSIGERLYAARPYLRGEEVFLANYADGLTDLPLPDLMASFLTSAKVGIFVGVKPSLSYHFIETDPDGTVVEIAPAHQLDLRVNGGYFIFRNSIFDYLKPGEDLVAEPFDRLIAERSLQAHLYDGFWKNMDTFKDKQMLDELWASGRPPWQVWKKED